MEKALNYQFERRSKSYFDWLYEVIRSEKYYQADAVVVMKDISNSYHPREQKI